MDEKQPSSEALKAFVRRIAPTYLEQKNVTSVGIGYKIKDGERTREICVQFTVEAKVAPEALESIDAVELPESFEIEGVQIPTDVLQRTYKTHASVVNAVALTTTDRKSIVNPIVPGVSVGHRDISAGTVGCVVYDAQSGTPYILSNWHVLNGPTGNLGDQIVQPGRHDDDRVDRNVIGNLVRSHLGVAGDCAIATVEYRQLDDNIFGLDTIVSEVGEPELGDHVVKSGRTTDITYGIVNRIHVTVKIDYPQVGEVEIGCFEIGPDSEKPASGNEISMGGDSGSAWLWVSNGEVTEVMLGLHFAGEVGDAPDHALACYAKSVFVKLGIAPTRPDQIRLNLEASLGYSVNFLQIPVKVPSPNDAEVRDDFLEIGGQTIFNYMHFSLAMSVSRRFARWVAWNVDGNAIRRLSRNGLSFKKDSNLPLDAQIGNELYVNNLLDRGHIARRADLVWGSIQEAEQANEDSFFYTNISPQHESFNRSSAHGIWGELENAIFSDVDLEDLRVSVMGGPIFTKQDPVFRDVRIPRQFWKIIYFREANNPELKILGYILSQTDLLNQLEVLELPEFSVFQVPVETISQFTGLIFAVGVTPEFEVQAIERLPTSVRRINSVNEILG